MKKAVLKSDFILLSTAIIWGFAFVAQRAGMEHIGPFLFNGVRFALGCLVLLFFMFIMKNNSPSENPAPATSKALAGGSILAGLLLFGGASFQQVGIVYTTAGKAGFITGLYVIIVPFLGLFVKQKTNPGTWTGAILAAVGMYFLSVTEAFTIAYGDFLVLLCAVFFAGHVLIIGWLSPRMNSLRLAFAQYAACSILSLIVAVLSEEIVLADLIRALVPILYGGIMSVGIAYTLQVVGQRRAHPAHAAILLSLEAVFATIGGWLLLNEIMSFRQLSGCALMLIGMIVSQLWIFVIEPTRRNI